MKTSLSYHSLVGGILEADNTLHKGQGYLLGILPSNGDVSMYVKWVKTLYQIN